MNPAKFDKLSASVLALGAVESNPDLEWSEKLSRFESLAAQLVGVEHEASAAAELKHWLPTPCIVSSNVPNLLRVKKDPERIRAEARDRIPYAGSTRDVGSYNDFVFERLSALEDSDVLESILNYSAESIQHHVIDDPRARRPLRSAVVDLRNS